MAYLSATAVKAKAPELTTRSVSDADVDALVAEFEELAEDYCGVAFTPRTVTGAVIWPRRSTLLFFPHSYLRTVTAVSVDGTAFTSDELTDFTGTDLDLASGIGTRYGWGDRVVVTYTHGLDSPPEAILRACVDFVKAKGLANASSRPKEVIGYTDDSGWSYRLGTPDPDNGRPTGVMEVDAVLQRMRRKYRVPTVA